MALPFSIRSLAAALLFMPAIAGAQLVREANTTLALPADLPAASGYTTVNAIPNGTPSGVTFVSPMCTAFPPGETNRLYVAQRAGQVQVVNNLSSSTPTQATFMNLAAYLTGLGHSLPATDEYGLLSMAFHPNYNQNGYFYLYFTIIISGQAHERLARFQATGTPGNYNAATSADPATMMPLLTMRDEAINHNGGDLNFGPDGYLYLSLGDEGAAGDSLNNARFINKDFWGQMLRIAVADRVDGLDVFPPNTVDPNPHSQTNSTSHTSAVHPGAYKVPADNPFIGYTSWHGQTIASNTVRTEIYATGFRNPFRFSIDPPTGRIFLGDVGQGDSGATPNISYEEIDQVVAGGDYGWSWREGFHVYNNTRIVPNLPPGFPGPGDPRLEPSTGFDPIDPIYEYGRAVDSNAVVYGTSVCGGMVYRGNQLTELAGVYLFAEIFGNNAIVALRETSPGVWAAQRLATRPQIVDFGTDPRNGEPLLTTLGGTIVRIQRSGTSGTPPPSTLSATGAFSNLTTLAPNSGIVPYDPNVAFWSDYAIKSRWFSIKNLTDMIAFSADGNWTFPTGMVWIKHFDFELERGNAATRRRLETRFLVKTATDIYGLSYRWNNIASGSQTDATLVAEEGLTETISGSSPAQTWRYPSRGECRTCHTAIAGFALSFNTRQLNRTRLYNLQTQNQIAALCGSSGNPGYFSNPPADVHTLPAFASATDNSQSLEWRVRSYLAVNCVQCHQPGGGASGNWDARPTTATDAAGLIHGLLVNNGGDTAARWAVPGDAPAFGQPTHSMALRRIRGDGASRMPPLATSERDLEAETLLAAWITQSLPNRQNFAQWQVAEFGSTGAPEAAPAADPDADGHRNEFEFLRLTDPQVADPPFSLASVPSGGNFQLTFTQPANRALQIETSLDLQNWSLWNVPGNTPTYPASSQVRTLIGPMDAPARFFRARITAP